MPLETLLAVAQSRPEVAAARAAVTESQWQLALARAEAVPDLEIGPRGQTVIGRWDDTAGGRVQFDVPLFNRNQGGIAESSASIRASRAGLEAAELRTLNDVAAAHAELMPLRSRLDYYEKHVVPLAASTEAMILEVYKNRAIEAVQVSELQQKFAKMRLSHLELRYRYNQVLMQLELFLGRASAISAIRTFSRRRHRRYLVEAVDQRLGGRGQLKHRREFGEFQIDLRQQFAGGRAPAGAARW